MDSVHSKIRRLNEEGERDRLSSLPDDVIHKILSCLKMREAIGMCVLSSRWRFIWTSMPYLTLSSEDFLTLQKFSKFATHVLSNRNKVAEVYSLNLKLRVKTSQMFVRRILSYAFSHNIQQLNVICLLKKKNIEFPLSLFSCQSLKHLSLTMEDGRPLSYCVDTSTCLTSTWELPTLTTLDLHSVTLRDDICSSVFFKCVNLKNLTLKQFSTIGSKGFTIFHPRLSKLTLEDKYCENVVNVVAPKLKNLTIGFCSGKHVISAPKLTSLFYEGSYGPLLLSEEGFLSLEKADICFSYPQDAEAHQIVCLLQQLHNVKFLTLNLEIVEFLSSSVDLILHQPSPFVNLKSLKIYPERKEIYGEKVTIMSNELKSYLLDGSPGSIFTMVFREEIQVQKLMSELRVRLEKERDNNKTNRAHLDPGKTHMEIHTQKMAQIKSCWEKLGVQIEKASVMMSKLQDIEDLLRKLPALKRAKIAPCFSSLCEDTDFVISKIASGMKIQFDENQSRSSVFFHELATTA